MQSDGLVPAAVLLVFPRVRFVGSKKTCDQDNASGLGSEGRCFFAPGPCWEPGFTRDMPRRLPFAWKPLCSGGELEQPSCYRPLSIIRRLKAKEPSLSSNPEGRAATKTDHLSLAKGNFTPGVFHGTRNQPPSLFVIIHLS